MKDTLLSLLSAANKPLAICEIIRIFSICGKDKNYKNYEMLFMSIHQSLQRLIRDGYVYRFRSKNIRKFRYAISDDGLRFLAQSADLKLVKEVSQRVS